MEGHFNFNIGPPWQTGKIYTNTFAYLMTISKVVELVCKKEEDN